MIIPLLDENILKHVVPACVLSGVLWSAGHEDQGELVALAADLCGGWSQLESDKEYLFCLRIKFLPNLFFPLFSSLRCLLFPTLIF